MGIIILLAFLLIIVITLIGIFSWDIRLFFRSISWRHRGRPMIKYPGFNCGCCGKWWDLPFEIRDYESLGESWDRWGLCPEGKGCQEKIFPKVLQGRRTPNIIVKVEMSDGIISKYPLSKRRVIKAFPISKGK